MTKRLIICFVIFACVITISNIIPKSVPSPTPFHETLIYTKIRKDSIKLQTVDVDDSVIVYMEEDRKVYHLGHCDVYKEKGGTPVHLVDVVMDATRCGECISDDMFYTHREAIYHRNERERQSKEEGYLNEITNLHIIVAALAGILIFLIAVIFIFHKKDK